MDAGGRRRREQAVEEARSRDGQEALYAARGHACMDGGGRRRREQAVEDARSRDGQEVRYAARGRACMDARLQASGRGGRRRLEQAVEEARSRPAKAGIPLSSFRRRPESSG